jgi:tRNA (cytidine32/uridine32-2'-O)-methyltransferase
VSAVAPIRFVMVGTTHPGNIGAAARAIKTMGFTQLDLVSPRHFPHPDAVAMASGAEDLFAQTRLYETLSEAVADCGLVIGLTSRSRRLASEILSIREAGARVIEESARHPVALLFGCEHSGLSNDELNRCHYHLHIPTQPNFASLNVAAAIQLIAYELRMAQMESLANRSAPLSSPSGSTESVFTVKDSAEVQDTTQVAVQAAASQEEVDRLVQHLERSLLRTGFLDAGNPRRLIYRLRRFFQRARPDQNEVNIWRGILTSFDKEASRND